MTTMTDLFGVRVKVWYDGDTPETETWELVFDTPTQAFRMIQDNLVIEEDDPRPKFDFTFDEPESWGGQVGWDFVWAHPQDGGYTRTYTIFQLRTVK